MVVRRGEQQSSDRNADTDRNAREIDKGTSRRWRLADRDPGAGSDRRVAVVAWRGIDQREAGRRVARGEVIVPDVRRGGSRDNAERPIPARELEIAGPKSRGEARSVHAGDRTLDHANRFLATPFVEGENLNAVSDHQRPSRSPDRGPRLLDAEDRRTGIERGLGPATSTTAARTGQGGSRARRSRGRSPRCRRSGT
jgi:hypothetical protein